MSSTLCNTCEMTKPNYEFNHRSNSAAGFRFECKTCAVQQKKQWREANRDHVNEQQHTRYAANAQVRINDNIHQILRAISKVDIIQFELKK